MAEKSSMTDPPPYPGTDDDRDVAPDRGPTTGPPRWVPVVGISIAVALVLLLAVLHLTGVVGPGAQ